LINWEDWAKETRKKIEKNSNLTKAKKKEASPNTSREIRKLVEVLCISDIGRKVKILAVS